MITGSVATNEQYTPNEYNPVNPDTKIYIRADGSIEPSTANITTTETSPTLSRATIMSGL